jgi:hypothetical protein
MFLTSSCQRHCLGKPEADVRCWQVCWRNMCPEEIGTCTFAMIRLGTAWENTSPLENLKSIHWNVRAKTHFKNIRPAGNTQWTYTVTRLWYRKVHTSTSNVKTDSQWEHRVNPRHYATLTSCLRAEISHYTVIRFSAILDMPQQKLRGINSGAILGRD